MTENYLRDSEIKERIAVTIDGYINRAYEITFKIYQPQPLETVVVDFKIEQ